jgi:RNA polymerase sigma factor (sigma-70 family)
VPTSTLSRPVHSSSRPNADLDLNRLLVGVAAGDPTAWSTVLQRYTRLLRHVCRQHRMSPEQTEDVLQTTWVGLFRHADGIRNADGLAGWLVTTTRRECVAVRRREAREIPTDDCGGDRPDPDVDISVDVGEHLDAGPRRRQLHQAVSMLPARERALMEILLEPDLPSYQEISRRLEMPVGAIGPVRRRALHRLHTRLVRGGTELDLEASA